MANVVGLRAAMTDHSVRIAVVGVGHMGAAHATDLSQGKVPRATLSAVCDPDPKRLEQFPGVRGFTDLAQLLAAGVADAALIASPHFAHTPLAIQALHAGLHVLCEKPLAVHVVDAERMLAAHTSRSQRFAVMLNLRSDARYLRLRELIRSGALGELQRIHWTLTNSFRHDAYYADSPWRGTWSGEGGGVLINQAPHYLDLWQWLFGMPSRVHAFLGLGRFHAIEVEDQVTAYLEHASGATGVLVASTGESPGSNRLEVVGNRATVILEREAFAISYAGVAGLSEPIEVGAARGSRTDLIRNFVNAILEGEALFAPADEGLPSVALANALIYSGIRQQTLSLPLDPALYVSLLTELVAD